MQLIVILQKQVSFNANGDIEDFAINTVSGEVGYQNFKKNNIILTNGIARFCTWKRLL